MDFGIRGIGLVESGHLQQGGAYPGRVASRSEKDWLRKGRYQPLPKTWWKTGSFIMEI